ncbi:ATPase, T2SS/T4P/T4SS family [Paracandidimonas lactea]|uniref:ATPase, T2SS/T4P/T4SS family n=1 Tax=Paracandidimonas lactea TaxID=2895524 RepID=UPI001F2A3FAC|nr:ATPase, T2SS/T4P/T4SS family [Paracandidimonas lactea]
MVELELRLDAGEWVSRSVVLPLHIGRGAECGLRLRSWRIARRHACLDQRPLGVYVRDLGSVAGTQVNGANVIEYGPLGLADEISIGPCTLRLGSRGRGTLGGMGTEQAAGGCVPDRGLPTGRGGLVLHADGELCAQPEQGNESVRGPVAQADAERGVGVGVVSPAERLPDSADTLGLAAQDMHLHRRRLHARLLEALDLRRRDVASLSDEALRGEAAQVLAELIAADTHLPVAVDRAGLLHAVVNEAVGLGVLEPLLADPAITEIMVNRHDEIFVEIAGRLSRHAGTFSSEDAVRGVIDRIVSPLGRRIDESSPMVDARLADGSRINAVIPPVALRGASLTIRKFAQSRLGMDDLLNAGGLNQAMSEFLAACVASRKNLIVSGGTGTGKTTLLNILSNCIGEHERIVTIEDAAELRLSHGHLVALESRPVNSEGTGRVDIRDLVRNALRMRPDRIVVGECRGGEAFDMLAAMNTGHEGSLTTLHANSPRDALARLETMILMAGMDLPLLAVREHIAASIHFIVQQARLADGRRLVSSIVEVTGMESGRIQTQEIFRYQSRPVPGFAGCGVIPECFMDGAGAAAVPLSLFTAHTVLAPAAPLQG